MRADGGEFPVVVAVARTGQAPPRFTAWIRDLSEPKAVEAESIRWKVLLDRAERVAQIGGWEWTPATGELLWSNNLSRLFGLEPGELAPSLQVLVDRTHPDDQPKLKRELESAKRGGTLPPLDLRVVRPDRSVRHLRATGGLEGRQKDDPRRLVGSVRDVTEERRAERELAAHLAVSEALAVWDSLEPGGERLLRDLAAALEFAVGALWLPRGSVLVARLFCTTGSVTVPEYERVTRQLQLPMGLGFPGQAWERREPVDSVALAGDRFVRRDAAARDGLSAGVAIPALSGEEVVAVVELCSQEPVELTDRLMRLLTGVGYELGTFLSRRRGELNPPPLSPRQLEILQLVARGVSARDIAEQLVISPSTVKRHFEHVYERLGVSSRAAAVAQAMRDGLIQ